MTNTNNDYRELWNKAIETETTAEKIYTAAKDAYGVGFTGDEHCNTLYAIYETAGEVRRAAGKLYFDEPSTIPVVADVISVVEPS